MASKLDRFKIANGATPTASAPPPLEETPTPTSIPVAPLSAPAVAPAVIPEIGQWIAVFLEPEVAAHYASLAADRGLSLPSLLTERLSRCRTHDDVRPLYLNDAERTDLELLVGIYLKSGAHALERIRQLTRVRIEGTAPDGEVLDCQIQLPPNVLDRLQSRKPTRDTTLADYVVETTLRLLLEYTRLH